MLALTKVLLNKDFGIIFDMPVGAVPIGTTSGDRPVTDQVESYEMRSHLVPALTRSLNYVHFVEQQVMIFLSNELLHGSKSFASSETVGICSSAHDISNKQETIDEETQQLGNSFEKRMKLVGIDIGTGASCIFPLLFLQKESTLCQLIKAQVERDTRSCSESTVSSKQSEFHFHVQDLQFVATDIVKNSITAATKLAECNNQQHNIHFWLSSETSSVFPLAYLRQLVSEEPSRAFFVVCNPPFFETYENETSDFGGKQTEKSCKGGEYAFVEKMILESVQSQWLQSNVIVFTSMLGRKSSLERVLKMLSNYQTSTTDGSSERRIEYVSCTTLSQGQTNRWAVSWSFHANPYGRQVLEQSSESSIILDPQSNVWKKMTQRLKSMETCFHDSEELASEIVTSRLLEFLSKRTLRFGKNGIAAMVYVGVKRISHSVRADEASQITSIHNVALYSALKTVSKEIILPRPLVGVVQVARTKDKVFVTLVDQVCADRLIFNQFCQQLRADLLRNNRFWRRKQAISHIAQS